MSKAKLQEELNAIRARYYQDSGTKLAQFLGQIGDWSARAHRAGFDARRDFQ